MNNIDILEEFLDYYGFLKTVIGSDDIRQFEIKISKNDIKAISNIIAENKELKEEKEELKRENLEIRDWKYVIDSPTDLDKLKELDLIKIKGKEYISVDKIKAKIEVIKDKEKKCILFISESNCKNICMENCGYAETIEVLQSLLEKE